MFYNFGERNLVAWKGEEVQSQEEVRLLETSHNNTHAQMLEHTYTLNTE